MKKSHIIGLFLIAVSIAIIISMVGDASSYESFASARSGEGKEFHVIGELVDQDKMYYNPEENTDYFSFYLKDKDGEVRKVVFNDTKPRDFERSEEVVLTGKMVGEEFQASKILLKCPSKYVDDELPDAGAKLEAREFKAGG